MLRARPFHVERWNSPDNHRFWRLGPVLASIPAEEPQDRSTDVPRGTVPWIHLGGARPAAQEPGVHRTTIRPGNTVAGTRRRRAPDTPRPPALREECSAGSTPSGALRRTSCDDLARRPIGGWTSTRCSHRPSTASVTPTWCADRRWALRSCGEVEAPSLPRRPHARRTLVHRLTPLSTEPVDGRHRRAAARSRSSRPPRPRGSPVEAPQWQWPSDRSAGISSPP